ncbi:MAG TPA: SpoIIE family protein phosphatase [Methanocorpusculum sp.]|nr:SpoIIE family protein phosphatase [Methanocorpusculum sp.]
MELETSANKFSLFCLILCVVLTFVCVIVGSIKAYVFYVTLGISLCALAVILIHGWKKSLTKYILLSAISLIIIVIMFENSRNLLFIPFLPPLISCLYFKPRITISISFLMVAAVPVTSLLAIAAGELDEAMININFIANSGSPLVMSIIVKTITSIGILAIPVIITIIGQNIIIKQTTLSQHTAGLQKELALASSIQLGMLPAPIQPRPEYYVTAAMHPASEVGGDYYDYFMTDEKHVVIMVADVSGHGIPAALFLANVKSCIRSFSHHTGLPVDTVVNRVNRELCALNSEKMFVTGWIGYVDLETGILKYVNAGHNPPALRTNNGEFKLVKSKPDFVLGRKRLTRYTEQTITLSEGDRLFLYTDGIVELANPAGEFFGEGRLLDALNTSIHLTASDFLQKLTNELSAFRGSREPADDITMLAFEFNQYYNKPEPLCLEVRSDTAGYEKLMKYVTEIMTAAGCNRMILSNISIAVSELLSNIILHSFEGKPDGTISLSIHTFNRRAFIVITDNGRYFDPLDFDYGECKTEVKSHRNGGLGIYMVSKLTDRIKYRYENKHNIITLEVEY